MSNVQLSLSLERLVARRTFPLQKRTSVCRNLFGPVDHDELHREMKSKLLELSERDQERWNFNFETSSPLDGLYEWEEVSAEDTPLFYQDSVRGDRRRVPATPVKRRPVDEPLSADSVMERLSAPEAPSSPCPSPSSPCPTQLNQENRKDKMNSGRTNPARAGVKRRRTTSADNNTHITDFFVKRKRLVDLSSCHQSSKSPIPVEQTPRKRIR